MSCIIRCSPRRAISCTNSRVSFGRNIGGVPALVPPSVVAFVAAALDTRGAPPMDDGVSRYAMKISIKVTAAATSMSNRQCQPCAAVIEIASRTWLMLTGVVKLAVLSYRVGKNPAGAPACELARPWHALAL